MERHLYRLLTVGDDDADMEKPIVLDPDDNLYKKLRHEPLWRANDVVTADVRAWTEQDACLKDLTTGDQANRASCTLKALQCLPQHKAAFQKLDDHSKICELCMELVEEEHLVQAGAVAALMQDMACNMDSDGQELSAWAVDKRLRVILDDKNISADTKARLLLVYHASPHFGAISQSQGYFSFDANANLGELMDKLARPDDYLLSHASWKRVQLAPETPEHTAAREAAMRERLGAKLSPRSRDMHRFQPRLRPIVEDIARGRLDADEFTQVLKTGNFESDGVVVFVVGGVCLSEARAAIEASRAVGREIIVGGNSLLTPGIVLRELRQAASGRLK